MSIAILRTQASIINPAYFLSPLCPFTLYLSGTFLSRFIALPDLNRFRLTKPLILFIDYLLLEERFYLLFMSYHRAMVSNDDCLTPLYTIQS